MPGENEGAAAQAAATVSAATAATTAAATATPVAAEGTTGDQGKGGTADAPTLHGAPEKYVDFTMPQGVEADKALIETALPVFKELNLSQQGAQKLVDFHNGQLKAAQEASDKAWNDTIDGWNKQTKDDPEIGGAKYDASIASAIKVVNTVFAKPEERQAWADFVNSTGVGNHPVLTRLLTRLGAFVKEDGAVHGGSSESGEKLPLEQRLYPTMKAQQST